jgi:hypothetical protein
MPVGEARPLLAGVFLNQFPEVALRRQWDRGRLGNVDEVI